MVLNRILQIGVPAIVSMLSALFIEVVNTAFVGHIGDEAMMAGVGMANMYVNITGLSVMFGTTNTLNTLISQSFGMGNYHLCGVYLNRCRILITVFQIPLLVMMLKAEAIFNTLGFDPSASYYS